MKWALGVLSAAVLALAVGTFALTAQGEGQPPHQTITPANASSEMPAPTRSAKPAGKVSQPTPNRRCNDDESGDGDPTGDDNGSARTGGSCQSDSAGDSAGDDQAGDGNDSHDDQAGDGRESGDDQAGDGHDSGD